MSAEGRSKPRVRRPRRTTVVKGALSYAGGWAMIGHQLLFVPRSDFNTVVWISALTMIGYPGAALLLPGLLSRIGIGGQSSASAERDSQQPDSSLPSGS